MTEKPILQAKNLSIQLLKNLVLNDLNFEIHSNEIVVLLGANGSGKTTLLKACAGLLKPTQGDIFYQGTNLKEMLPNQYAKLFSYVPQTIFFDADMKIYDYISLGRYPFTGVLPILSKEDHAKIAESIQTFNLDSIARKKMNEVSGGEQQRTHLARVLTANTELLIFDEPTNSLDIKHQRNLLLLIKQLQQHKKTILLALHSIDLAIHIADRLILLKEGKILFSGKPNPNTQPLEKILSQVFDTPVVQRNYYNFQLP